MQLTDLSFEQRLVSKLPGEAETAPRPRQVLGACYSRVLPTPVAAPTLLAWSEDCAALLGLSEVGDSGRVAEVLAGNRLLPGMAPFAACYGGHQFGNWAGQLGDGRAITLGESLGPDGVRYELQLKGAGLTPYSRSADGRAVLRSSVREFLCSEAMHHLGVPTTRALSLVTTGEPVLRDMFYDGNAAPEPGAVVCRVAPSFLRFGNLELPAARGDQELLVRLADFVQQSLFPETAGSGADAHRVWFGEVCRRTAVMVAHWMRVGFVHGVMNTDNMSLLGLTIDYGPYGWLEGFEPDWTPNTTDLPGRRYCYGNQPGVALWNLARLGQALGAVGVTDDDVQAGLEEYRRTYESTFGSMLADKLGLVTIDDESELIDGLFSLLQQVETDMTLFFRRLAQVPMDHDLTSSALHPLLPAYYSDNLPDAELLAWLERYRSRLQDQGVDEAQRRARMNAANPKYVLRNYLAQQAIDAATAGDAGPVNRLLAVLRQPYAEQPEHEDLAARRPEWARHKAGCSMLSCSS
ncbi:MAG: YdiU family protein [Gammaproteobacteria bacterium]|nr:YdiU family protein [Gammaproteobacteria bacterium]